MRGLAGMVVAAAAMLTAVPGASAGSYDVVSCGAPGAGGVNGAWRVEYGGFPPDVQPDPSSYQVIDQCPTQLFIRALRGPTARPRRS